MDANEQMIKKQYEELEQQENELRNQFNKQIAEIQKKKLGAKKYLEAFGFIEVKKRGRKKKETKQS